jgi:hypothetical protein
MGVENEGDTSTLTDKFSALTCVLIMFDEVSVLFADDTASVEGDVATLSDVLSEVVAEKSSS